jgi:hypothetical protein
VPVLCARESIFGPSSTVLAKNAGYIVATRAENPADHQLDHKSTNNTVTGDTSEFSGNVGVVAVPQERVVRLA